MFDWKWFILALFITAALYVHFRGQVRFGLLRQLGNHSVLLAPYNVLMYLFSAIPARPVLDNRDFPGLAHLQENWLTIRDEARALFDQGYIGVAEKNNDVGFNSFFKRGWKRFYLKWYGTPLASALDLCPRTVALLEATPGVRGAMFALLPAGGRLTPHRDPFAGSLRYHLGLITPNSDACHIVVDGNRLSWRDGESFLFDETYIHHAVNDTDQNRIILFCDVERPLRNRFMTWLNRGFARLFVSAAAAQNLETDKVGLINRLYGRLHVVRAPFQRTMRRLKHANKPLYRLLQYSAIGLLLYWLLF